METVQIIRRTRQNRTMEQIVDVSIPQVKEKIAEVIQLSPQEHGSVLIFEQIVRTNCRAREGMVTSPRRRLRWTILLIPSSQSTAHAEACRVIVERVDMELGALPPPLADREPTSSVFAFLRLATATFATSSSGMSRFSRDAKVQKLTARLISSELSAHQMSLSGVTQHWRSRPALQPT